MDLLPGFPGRAGIDNLEDIHPDVDQFLSSRPHCRRFALTLSEALLF